MIWFLPFLLLPIWPLAASLLFIASGLFAIHYLKNASALLWGMGCFVALTCISQVFSPSPPTITPPSWPGSQANSNLILPHLLSRMIGFSPEDTQVTGVIKRENEFWRISRANPTTGHLFTEMHLTAIFPIEEGKTYTQSFFFKHDGSASRFQFSFFTAHGHHPIETTLVDVDNGIKRAYATYTPQEGDQFIRGLDIVNLQGDWSYIEFAYPQLEISPTPSGYHLSTPKRPSLSYRLAWFISMGILGLLAFAGGRWISRTPPESCQLSNPDWNVLYPNLRHF